MEMEDKMRDWARYLARVLAKKAKAVGPRRALYKALLNKLYGPFA